MPGSQEPPNDLFFKQSSSDSALAEIVRFSISVLERDGRCILLRKKPQVSEGRPMSELGLLTAHRSQHSYLEEIL